MDQEFLQITSFIIILYKAILLLLSNNVAAPHVMDTSESGNKYMVDPLFLNAPSAGRQLPPRRLPCGSSSPAINMGDNTACIEEFDLDLKPRVNKNIIDLGAYEQLLNCDSITLL